MDHVEAMRDKRDVLVREKMLAEERLVAINVEISSAKLRARNRGAPSRSAALVELAKLQRSRGDDIRTIKTLEERIGILRSAIRKECSREPQGASELPRPHTGGETHG
jgi:hypothetical protein